MSEDTLAIDVVLSERERFTLAVFFTSTYKPKNKTERKAMRLAFRRLQLDGIIARGRRPGGIKPELLSDVPTVVALTEEAIDWAIANLNQTQSETADSLILADLEERFEEVKAKAYVLPPDAVRPKAVLTSVPAATPPQAAAESTPPQAAPEAPPAS